MSDTVRISDLPAEISWDNVATPHRELYDGLKQIGMESFCPAPYTTTEALYHTLQSFGREWRKRMRAEPQGGDVTFDIKPHKKRRENGYEFRQVIPHEVKNQYSTLFSVKVDLDTEHVIIRDGEFPGSKVLDLQLPYYGFRATCSSSAVGQSLKNIIYSLHGNVVRSAGGVYFLYCDVLPKFEHEVAPVYRQFNNKIHVTRIILDDAYITDKLLPRLTEDLLSEIEKITEDIANNDYGDEALLRRKAEAIQIRQKAQYYEPIVQGQLSAVHEALAVAEDAITQARAQEEDTEIFKLFGVAS